MVLDGEVSVPHFQWDERSGRKRALGFRYRDVVDYLRNSGIDFRDRVFDLVACPDLSLDSDMDLRSYQVEALESWFSNRRGVLVLPTGSGKTFIGLKAIERLNTSSFIVVPTLDLVDQWISKADKFNVEVGEFTGRKKDLCPITVSTYDSAYNSAGRLGNRFKFVVFDEVHHLPSEGYQHIAEFFASPYRLGLTATYEREDGRHEKLTELLGGKSYEIETDELAGDYLSKYSIERIKVDLTPEEKDRYEENVEVFRDYLKKTNIRMRGASDFKKVVMRSGNDPEAWKAVRSRNKARKIAYNSSSKLDELSNLLGRHKDDRVIVFTRYNELVYRISKRFLLPAITHKTNKSERKEILNRFRDGEYSGLVSSQVLDEGLDVPDANIGIILSGTGSSREYLQRLGRILRPSGKKARLYEIVSSGTGELRTSSRRRSSVN
ncbi:MAG: ssDNA-dependent ATPase helicase superfamily II XpB [Candidatus Methanohalarchaeum thermophilum]|uniref:DNA 3'-5' helicase n=1 Tax=Methanohalarchaeum thermophilum TaxID=1903181 RepID=A0A1Q6DT53_METT1|nr:MAG: ssDNA-dependent ATPase helicase superfamily II XpB [Candidatus Methanohalarchaeum thermophilum]